MLVTVCAKFFCRPSFAGGCREVYCPSRHGLRTRTVLDWVASGTFPGALLRTLVAQQALRSPITEVDVVHHGLSPAATGVPAAVTTPAVYRQEPAPGYRLRCMADLLRRGVLSVVLSPVIATGGGDVVIHVAEATFIATATVPDLAVAPRLQDGQDLKLTVWSPSWPAGAAVFGPNRFESGLTRGPPVSAAIWMAPAVWASLFVILWAATWLEHRLVTLPAVNAELPRPGALAIPYQYRIR